MLSYGSWLLSWRGLLTLFLLANLKNLPLAWELRLIYRGWKVWKSKSAVAKILNDAASDQQKQHTTAEAETDADTGLSATPRTSHPLFAPITISSRTPLLETDHNLHKSNSTYFSDLDESRTALMTHLLSSTKFGSEDLEREGYKGRLAIVLGSVHTSFLKEIKPYEKYSIRSRVLGWDRKWIVIGSYFVKQAKGKEVLLACCLSKYVVKKGRYTVPPERCFRSSGWLPDRPADADASAAGADVPQLSQVATPDTNAKAADTAKDLVQEIAARLKQKQEQSQEPSTQKPLSQDDEACKAAAARWPWDEIETERRRGLKIAEKWLTLDAELKEEYEQEAALNVTPIGS